MGYTQQLVADRMGVSKSTYCGYETKGSRMLKRSSSWRISCKRRATGCLRRGFIRMRIKNAMKSCLFSSR